MDEATRPAGRSDLIEAMIDQWRSMVGMAAMFVTTILLAIIIQPSYDHDELRAFGAEGASKAGFVLLEGIMILVFTFLIIWLARKNMQRLIQIGMFIVLWIALLYTLVPLAHMVLSPDLEPMTPSQVEGGSHMLTTMEGGEFIFAYSEGNLLALRDAGAGNGAHGGADVVWSLNVTPPPGLGGGPLNMLTQDSSIVLCDGVQWRHIDAANGTVLENHTMSCQLGLTVLRDGGEESWGVIYGGVLSKVDPFHPDNPGEDWRWRLPQEFDSSGLILAQRLGDDYLLYVTANSAAVVVVPDDRHSLDPKDPLPFAETTWSITPPSGEIFTAAAFGHQVGHAVNESNDERALYIGTSGTSVRGFLLNGSDGSVSVEENASRFDERDAFTGPIRGLMLADCCDGGAQDLWVVDGDQLEVFMGRSLVDRSRGMIVGGEDPVRLALTSVPNPDWEANGLSDGLVVIETNRSSTNASWTVGTWAMPPAPDVSIGGVSMFSADIIGLVLSIAMIIGLIYHPEWWLVNTFGILVGAGVSVMLGVSFVPWLVILFMVGMAIYDHWAVHRSKHMLDLADTMIDLRLPILLVAPKGKNYSFLEEGSAVISDRDSKVSDEAMSEESTMGDVTTSLPPTDRFEGMTQTESYEPEDEEGTEAMFMGLGDVIFPGILVISALTWLPEGVSRLGFGSGPILVAIGTMIGGLLGYLVLMTQVARGKPQAGLPLLNGGSILGYLLCTILLIGPAALAFDISFF